MNQATKPPAPTGPAWIEIPFSAPAFRCQSCGKYVQALADGELAPHWLHLVGRDKRREAQHQCKDAAIYRTSDTARTPYGQRQATITAPELTPTEPMPTTPKPAGKFPFAVARRNGDRVILLHQVGKCAVARVYPADKSPAYHLARFRQHYADFEGLGEAGAAFQTLRRLDNAERHRDAETLRAADALDQLTVSRPCLERFCLDHGLDVAGAYPRRELRQAVTDLRLPKMAVYLALLKTLNPTNHD